MTKMSASPDLRPVSSAARPMAMPTWSLFLSDRCCLPFFFSFFSPLVGSKAAVNVMTVASLSFPRLFSLLWCPPRLFAPVFAFDFAPEVISISAEIGGSSAPAAMESGFSVLRLNTLCAAFTSGALPRREVLTRVRTFLASLATDLKCLSCS